MTDTPVLRDDQASLPLFDKEAIDIADYLKSESDEPTDIHSDQTHQHGVALLTLGAIGVVYGDIGTSPIYAFRASLRATSAAVPGQAEVLGILSLLIWTLRLIVTVKYVFFLLRSGGRISCWTIPPWPLPCWGRCFCR